MGIRLYTPADVEQVIAVLERAGVSQTAEAFERNLDEPGERSRDNTFVLDLDGHIIGFISLCFVQTRAPWSFTVFCSGTVDPHERARGFGRELYEYALRHLALVAAREKVTITLAQNVDAGMAPQRALLKSLGFTEKERIASMRLERLPQVFTPAPPGYTIRKALAEDAEACAGVYNSAFSWRESTTVMTPESIAYELPDRDATGVFSITVAASDGTVVGYARCTLSSNGGAGPIGYVHTIALLPAHQRRGLGRSLLGYCLAQLHNDGAIAASLSVEASNPTRAVPLYLSVGFRKVKEWIRYNKPVLPASSIDAKRGSLLI